VRMPAPSIPVREILADLRSPQCLSGISIGLVISLMVVVIEVSFAAMIFSGPLAFHAQRGMGLTLAGSLILVVVTALFSGFRPNINISQDAPTAIFAGAAAGIAAAMGAGRTDEVFITVVAALVLSTLATGLFFLLAGRFRLAEYVRFMPYPVVAGFLAGTGWLLTRGSLEVMTGLSLHWTSLPRLLDTQVLLLWLPGAAYAMALLACLRRWSHFLILPGSMVGALVLYHAALPLFGLDMAQAREMGLFFATFSTGSVWPAFSPADLHHAHWSAVAAQLPTLAIIPFISLLGLLLNTGGIELASRRDLDLNRELMVNGGGNVLAALAGAPAGYSALSLSMLGFKTGADTRIVGLTATVVLAGTLFLGGQILSVFPKALLGGFLLLLGLMFLSDWIVDTRARMPRADYLVVLAVFGAIGVFGYLQGVLLGLLATVVLFVARFSKIPALFASSTIAQTRSRRQRSLPHQRLLATSGGKVHVFELSGYLFFGSVNALNSAIMNAMEGNETHGIVVDFHRVSGFDISAVNNFVRLAQRLTTRQVAFVLAGAPELFSDLLRQAGGKDVAENTHVFPDRNAALEWCEDMLLEEAQNAMGRDSAQARQARAELFDHVSDVLLRRLEQQEQVENLLERLSPFLETQTYSSGATLLKAGEIARAMIFVQRGVVREFVADAAGRQSALRSLGPATFFAEPAAYAPWPSPHVYLVESETEAALLTPEALRTVEIEDPQTALEVHRLVVAALAWEGRGREAA
jgi:sulfate permease, SulP family